MPSHDGPAALARRPRPHDPTRKQRQPCAPARAGSGRARWRSLALLLVAACTAAPRGAVARSAPDSFSPLVKRVLPAVVNIAVTETVTGNDIARRTAARNCATPRSAASSAAASATSTSRCTGAGSGFIIDPSGIIVTNNHVVGHADKIVVVADRRPPNCRPHVIGTRRTDRRRGDQGRRASAALPAVAWGDSPHGRGRRLDPRAPAIRSGWAARSPPASSRPRAATSAPGRSTTSCSSTRRSIRATPAARCSTWTAR